MFSNNLPKQDDKEIGLYEKTLFADLFGFKVGMTHWVLALTQVK